MPFLPERKPRPNPAVGEVPVDADVRRAPTGLYSGMTKRLAISDEQFVEVHGDVAENYRDKANLND